jgi:hypothetical protein
MYNGVPCINGTPVPVSVVISRIADGGSAAPLVWSRRAKVLETGLIYRMQRAETTMWSVGPLARLFDTIL